MGVVLGVVQGERMKTCIMLLRLSLALIVFFIRANEQMRPDAKKGAGGFHQKSSARVFYPIA